MSRFLVGGIFFLLSFLVFYGAGSATRVAQWVDNFGQDSTAQVGDTVLTSDTQTVAVAANAQELTPVQKAGKLVQQQTFPTSAQSNLSPSNTTTAQGGGTSQNAANNSNASTPTRTSRPAVPALW